MTSKTVKFYCEVCEDNRPVTIEAMSTDDLNGDKIWGDILCSVCHFVIATVQVNEPGQYDFVRVNNG